MKNQVVCRLSRKTQPLEHAPFKSAGFGLQNAKVALNAAMHKRKSERATGTASAATAARTATTAQCTHTHTHTHTHMGNKMKGPEDRSERGGGGTWRWRRGYVRGSGEGAYDVEVLLDVRKEMFVEVERVVAVHAEPRRNAARDGAAAAEDARRLDDAPEDRRDEHEADALPLDQVDLDRDRSIDRQITAPPREESWTTRDGDDTGGERR